MAARPRRGPCDRRGPGQGAPDHPPAARQRRARHRGPGHPCAGAPPARDRLPAGAHHGARHDRSRMRPPPGRAPCCAGRTRTSWARCPPPRRTRWATAGRSSRSWTSGSRRTSSARSGGAARGSGCCPTRRRAADVLALGRGRRGAVARAPATRRAWTVPWRSPARSSRTAGRCWASAWATRSWRARRARTRDGCDFGHHGANHPVADLVHGPRPGHRAEPRGDRGGRLPARGLGLLRQPEEPQRRLRGGPAPRDAAHRDRPVPPGGIARAARRGGGLRPVPGARAPGRRRREASA